MKVLILILLFTSCATRVPNGSLKLKQSFKISTGCKSSNSSVEKISETKDYLGFFSSGSYRFTCENKSYYCEARYSAINLGFIYECDKKQLGSK